jgi:hypothetical protein
MTLLESSPYELCEISRRPGPLPSRGLLWHPSGWYKCRGGPLVGQTETSYNHKPRTDPPRPVYYTDTRGKECLSETSRPGLISAMRSDLPQPTHWFKPNYTSGGILLLRLQLVISVRRTESSVVVTTRCCTRKRSWSTRRESAKVCLRSLKGDHMLRI